MHVRYILPEILFSSGREVFFDRFFSTLEDLDDTVGELVESTHEESATQIKTCFSDDEEMTNVTIWEDYLAEIRYFEIAASDEAALDSIIEALASHFSLADHSKLLVDAARDIADPSIYYRIAYSAPANFSNATFKTICDGLDAESRKVREKAAVAAGLIGWLEFKPILHEADQKERPGPAKQAMQNAIRTFA